MRLMKKSRLSIIAGFTLLLAFMSAGLTSCVGDDDGWWGGPPTGWDTFNDTRLSGYWALVQYNSDPVDADDANYLYFNGNGRGLYYYLQGGPAIYGTDRLLQPGFQHRNIPLSDQHPV